MKRLKMLFTVLFLSFIIACHNEINDEQQSKDIMQEIEEFVKEDILRRSKGDLSFFNSLVDEYGESFIPENVDDHKRIYKEMVGEKGEKLELKSIIILEISKASDLFEHLPKNTTIKEYYSVEVLIDGNGTIQADNIFFGIKSAKVVVIDGKLFNYAGKHLPLSSNVLLKKDLLDLNQDCNSFINQKIRKFCWENLAVNDKDVSKCDNITDEDFKYTCYSNVAITSSDISICPKIKYEYSDSVINCYSNFARHKEDLTICDQIKDSEIRQGCIDISK